MDIDQLEFFCKELYVTTDPQVRAQAEKTCSDLCKRADCAEVCQLLLQRAHSCYAQLIAATALTKYISDRDTIIPVSTRLQTRDYVLNYLATHTGLEKFVKQALVTFLCRVTKFGWFDSLDDGRGFRDILNCASKFIESGQSGAILTGVQLLSNLVSEVNHNSESDLTRIIVMQRKRSASFRDSLLLPIFRLGLNLLREADKNIRSLDLNNADQHGLLSQSLQLVHSCLTFDFLGTSACTGSSICDESSGGLDDLVVIQIPTSWRSIFLDLDTVRLFFRLYSGLPAELSPLVLSCLVQLASVRRSLFTNPERASFLTELVCGIRIILANQSTSLSNPDTYHEFCRLLSRLKCNFQLTELIALDCYAEFIQLITGFTVHSIKSFHHGDNSNSIHYLLALWQRLVASLPYVQSPDSELLENAASQVSRAYIEACMTSVADYVNCPSHVRSRPGKTTTAASGKSDSQSSWSIFSSPLTYEPHRFGSKSGRGDDDLNDDELSDCPLDDLTTLLQQLEQFAVIGRCGYANTCTVVAQLFDESAGSYEKALTMIEQGSPVADPNLIQVIQYEEHRLAWLVYMVGALIGTRVNYTSSDDDYDGELVCRVLQLMRLTTNRLRLSIPGTGLLSAQQTSLTGPSTVAHLASASRLEMASLSFFEQFRRIYISESVGRMSRVYLRLSEVLGFSDDLTVLGVFGEKILTNMKCWTCHEPIMRRTLDLLSDLSRGYSAMRKLLRLDSIQFILTNHTEENFAFLASAAEVPNMSLSARAARYRLRTTFYASLARFLMVDLGEDEARFLNFMSPLTRVANDLILAIFSGSSAMTAEQVKSAVVGLARDLRGLSSSLNTKSAYQMLLEWFYPTGFKMFGRALELWPLDPLVSVSVLKLLAEVVHNRNGRLLFASTIPTGYLLFNELSSVLNTFGLQIIPHTRDLPRHSVYAIKLKPIVAALKALKTCISGNCINFGVFSLFREDSLEKAMEMGVQLMLCLDETELLEYPKVALAYFELLECMVNDHMIFVASLGGPVLNHFLNTIANNICSVDTVISDNCCLCLDYILTHLFKLAQQQQQEQQRSGLLNGSMGTTSDSNLRLISLDDQLRITDDSGTPAAAGAPARKHRGASRYAVWCSRTEVAETHMLDLLKPSSASLMVLQRLLVLLLSSVVHEECRNQWSISRPLLSLIFINHEYYLGLRNRLIASLPSDRQEAMTKLFDKLMEDVEFTLAGKDRDKFTQNVSSFKHALSEFMKPTTSSIQKESDSMCDSTATRPSSGSIMHDQTPTGSGESSSSECFCLSAAIVEAAGLSHVL